MPETKNVVKKTNIAKNTGLIAEERIIKEEKIIKEIEKILGKNGYKKFRQPTLLGEHKAAYVKGTRIIVISDTPEANDMQIQSVHTWHRVELSMAKGRAKEKMKNTTDTVQ